MAPWGKDWEISSSERAEHQHEPLVFPENTTKAMFTSKATTFTILTPSPTLKISLMPFFPITFCTYNKHATNLSSKSTWKPKSTWCAFSVEYKKRKPAASWQCSVSAVVCKLMQWGKPQGAGERGAGKDAGPGDHQPSGCWKILASYHFINLPFTNIFKNGIDCL